MDDEPSQVMTRPLRLDSEPQCFFLKLITMQVKSELTQIHQLPHTNGNMVLSSQPESDLCLQAQYKVPSAGAHGPKASFDSLSEASVKVQRVCLG